MYPVGNNLVPKNTPMHVTHLFLVYLKEVFRSLGGTSYPYKYTDSIETTGILFDTVFNRNSFIVGKKPLVVVSRGDVGTSPTVTGDIGGASLLGRKSGQVTVINSSVILKVLSASSEEVDILGNELFKLCVANRTFLTKITPVHSINTMSLSQIMEAPQDDNFYMCTLSINYMLQDYWKVSIQEQEYLHSTYVGINENHV